MKGRNTLSALCEYQNLIVNNLDKQSSALGLFIDFSRAFDQIDHALLLHKLSRYGIRGIALKLLESYIIKRYQIVELNGTLCKPRVVTRGVPQGSVLGPLLYVIYSNDLANYIARKNVTLVCYADDTNLLITGRNVSETIQDANKLYDYYDRAVMWAKNNCLLLNRDKTVSVVYSITRLPRPKNISNTSSLDFNLSSHVNMLGVTFDEALSWDKHIDVLCAKLRSCCFAIRFLSNHCSLEILINIYHANFHSLLRYGIVIWGGTSLVSRVLIIQKYAVRILGQLSSRASC